MKRMNNTNMYNQPNGMNNVPQNMGQPSMQPVYNGQPVNNIVNNGQPVNNTVNNMKNTLSNIDKDSAKRIIGMVCGVLLILAVFVPYISISGFGYSYKQSIWDIEATFFKIMFIVLGLVPIATFFFQKVKHLSYLSAGYALSFAVFTASSAESGLSFGFWLMIIASIVLIALCIMDDWAEIKTMFNTKPAIIAGGPVANVNMQMPQQQPMNTVAPVQPVVQSVEVCNVCGQPKRNPADVACPNCGQRY